MCIRDSGPSVPKMFQVEDARPYAEQIDGRDLIVPCLLYTSLSVQIPNSNDRNNWNVHHSALPEPNKYRADKHECCA